MTESFLELFAKARWNPAFARMTVKAKLAQWITEIYLIARFNY